MISSKNMIIIFQSLGDICWCNSHCDRKMIHLFFLIDISVHFRCKKITQKYLARMEMASYTPVTLIPTG